MPWKVQCKSCHIFCCIHPHSPWNSMGSLFAVLSGAVRSQWSSLGSYLDSLAWCQSVGYSVCLVVIFNLVQNQLGSNITAAQYGSSLVGLSSFLRHICRYIGRPSYARWAYRLRSRGALAGSPPVVLVDSSVPVLAITWLGALIVICCEPSQLMNESHGVSFLHLWYVNCLR